MKKEERPRMTMMDMDANRIGIDNRCTACVSHRKTDFIGKIIKTNQCITGFGGHKHRNISKGTIKWKINDDNGQEQEFIIPNSYYAPAGGCRLLSPQHWAHEYYKQTGKSAKETTTRHNIKLSWNNDKNNKTVDLDENGNVGNIYTTQGYGSIRQIYANNSTFKENEQDIDMNRQCIYWKTKKYMPGTKQINSQGNILQIDEMEEIPPLCFNYQQIRVKN